MSTRTPLLPWLLMDIDGVMTPQPILPSQERQLEAVEDPLAEVGSRTIYLNPKHREALLAARASVRLAWATWRSNSPATMNSWMGSYSPTVEFDYHADGASKVAGIVRFTAGEPFVWVDDDVTAFEVAELDRLCSAPHLVIPVDPSVGLTSEHLARAVDWAKGHVQ